jgi:epimerase transport system membrane fusion protein
VLQRTALRAPIDGTVVGLNVHTPGGVIAPGQALMDIVPLNDRLVIQASIDPQDIDQVRAGMAAHVELVAFNRRTRKPLEAEVRNVSADRIVDPRTGMAHYLARVELRGDASDAALLQPGMGADVMIRTGTRTPIDYLMEPIVRTLSRGLRES